MKRERTSEKDVKILWIGNSFTNRNNLPSMLNSLLVEKGTNIHSTTLFKGGASLQQHLGNVECMKLLNSGNFDYVILQEQSTKPWKNREKMHESVRAFHQAIQNKGGTTRTVLYGTWSKKDEPHNQGVIDEAYSSIAHELGITCVLVGPVWTSVQEEGIVNLYDSDKSHPSPAGTLLVAFCFAKVLFPELEDLASIKVKGCDSKVVASLKSKVQALLK